MTASLLSGEFKDFMSAFTNKWKPLAGLALMPGELLSVLEETGKASVAVKEFQKDEVEVFNSAVSRLMSGWYARANTYIAHGGMDSFDGPKFLSLLTNLAILTKDGIAPEEKFVTATHAKIEILFKRIYKANLVGASVAIDTNTWSGIYQAYRQLGVPLLPSSSLRRWAEKNLGEGASLLLSSLQPGNSGS